VRRRERGAALLLVLAAVALLTVLAVELASRASADSLRAVRAAREAAFRRAFDSGAEVGRGLLVEPDPAKVVHWSQAWNREIRFALADGQTAVVRLADESGKLNIARAISHPDEAPALRSAVVRLFEYLARRDARQAAAWQETGAKILRRMASKEPLLSLDGLRDAGVEASRVFDPDGLCRYLTCFGDGKINLNTAPRAVLASLDPEFDDAMVARIAGYRGKGEGEPAAYKPFDEPQDLMLVEGIVNRTVGVDGQLRIARNLFEKVQGLVTVGSSCFSARVEAVIDGKARQAWAFFKPNGSRLGFEEVAP
jgi:type II secretory pathway component PulK